MNKIDFEKIASDAFLEINKRFPLISFNREENPNCEISIPIPIQNGIFQEMWLGLNGDELLLTIGKHFWMEWFSIKHTEVTEEYVEAVCGFISGEYRVLEHYKGDKCTKAELQKPHNNSWKTIATWGRINFRMFTKKTFREIYNRPSATEAI